LKKKIDRSAAEKAKVQIQNNFEGDSHSSKLSLEQTVQQNKFGQEDFNPRLDQLI
jgi:hypothetical protein